MTTILFSAPYMTPVIDRFRPLFERYGIDLLVARVKERLNEDDLLEYAGKFDGTVCGDDRYSARVLEACSPRLKVISKWGTGIDSIDQQKARELGIQVRNTPNAFTVPVADTVLGYILSFARQLPWMDRKMKQGIWEKIPSVTLSECTLGVVGVGNIGKAILRRARVFGMKLLGNDIIEIAPDFIWENRIEMTSLSDLLSRADFVSLNCDLNPTSYHLINQKTIEDMKETGILINAARGPIVEEKALVNALESHKIAGAALDVYEKEPIDRDNPLLKFDNILLGTHNANSSPVAWERVHWNTVRNVLDGLGYSIDDLHI
ncbi:MAG TPA: phosphoglycerate dehydrogenase [Anaerolineae bacterium]|nr:phosphoglycerate dehydrogenase [Anaerolineae bacterium]